jgi:hypothetical protein
MGYSDWIKQHAKKHKKIVDKLLEKNYTQDQIIDYFDFENMKKMELDFCPLYAKDKKCHDMQELNCYLCSCPNFRFNDKGIKKIDDKTEFSYCSIDSKDGRAGVYGEKIHQDCSKCQVPHTKQYVQKHFSSNWQEIMQDCEISS